jgi:hypothetical protein
MMLSKVAASGPRLAASKRSLVPNPAAGLTPLRKAVVMRYKDDDKSTSFPGAANVSLAKRALASSGLSAFKHANTMHAHMSWDAGH